MLFYETLALASASTPEQRLPVDIKCKWLQNVALKRKKKKQKTSCAKKSNGIRTVEPQQLIPGVLRRRSPPQKEDDCVSQCQQRMRRAVANKTSVSAVLLPQGAIISQSPDVITYKPLPEIMGTETPLYDYCYYHYT